MAEKGQMIKVEYEGRFENGEVFDSSSHGDHSHPLEFELGAGTVIKGFEKAVENMNEGDEKEFEVLPEEAYGERNEELIQEIPKESFGDNPHVKEGATLVLQTPQGKMPVQVKEIKGDKVVLDLNHPLAGKKLIFKIKVVGIGNSK